ncbi:MAG: STAS domain-containing protein [Planctomycetaceae bacterium]
MTVTSTFSIGSTDDSVVVRITGHGTREHSPGFVEEVAAAVANAPDQTLVVDVEHCDYLDSTFLGCLVTLFRRTEMRMSVCASERRKAHLFSSARIDRLIPVCDPQNVTFPSQWRSICDDSPDDDVELARQVVESHRSLAEIGGPNARVFRSVAEQLESDLKARNIG